MTDEHPRTSTEHRLANQVGEWSVVVGDHDIGGLQQLWCRFSDLGDDLTLAPTFDTDRIDRGRVDLQPPRPTTYCRVGHSFDSAHRQARHLVVLAAEHQDDS